MTLNKGWIDLNIGGMTKVRVEKHEFPSGIGVEALIYEGNRINIGRIRALEGAALISKG